MPTKKGDFKFNADLERAVLWQYENAPNLRALIAGEKSFSDTNSEQFWENWFNQIFAISTANNFGLNLWGKVLGVARPSYTNAAGAVVAFSDDMYRKLLLARLMLCNSNGSVSSINRYLAFMFPNKPVFVVNYYNMTIKIILYYEPSLEDLAVIKTEGFIPVPAGVLVDYVIVPPDKTFGFEESELTGFDTGTFIGFDF